MSGYFSVNRNVLSLESSAEGCQRWCRRDITE